MAEWALAVDLGTTCTVAVHGINRGTSPDAPEPGPPTVLPLDGGGMLRSFVHLDSTGALLVGEPAARAAAKWPERTAPSAKTALAEGPEVKLGGLGIDSVDLAAAVLRRVADEAAGHYDDMPPSRTVLTHPPSWDETCLRRLGDAARRAGLGTPELLVEPVAAVHWHGRFAAAPEGAHVVVCDAGGGALTAAALRRTTDGWAVSGSAVHEPGLGGTALDRAVLELVERRATDMDPGVWQRLWQNAAPEARRQQEELRTAVTAAREALTDHMMFDVHVPGYGIPIRLLRRDVEQVIEPRLSAAADQLLSVLRDAGVPPAELSAVYLTGGTGRTPLVRELLTRALGRLPEVHEDSFHTVALGAYLRLTGYEPVPEPSPGRAATAETPAFDAFRTTPGAAPGGHAPTGWTSPDPQAAAAGWAPPAGGVEWQQPPPAVMFRGGMHRPGSVEFPGMAADNRVSGGWTLPLASSIRSSPTLAAGVVHVGCDDGYLYALDALTGGVVWRHRLGVQVRSSPAVAGDLVVVGVTDGTIRALDRATGVPRWSFATEGAVESSPVAVDGVVLVGGGDHCLHAVELATGTPLWSYRTGDAVRSSPAVLPTPAPVPGTAGYLACVGGADGLLHLVDAGDGQPRWTYAAEGPIDSSPAVCDTVVYVGSGDGYLHAVDLAAGAVRWRYPTGGAVTSSPAVLAHPAGGAALVVVGSDDQHVHAVEASTGVRRWMFRTGGAVSATPALIDGVAYVGSADGRLYALDVGTGAARWAYRTGGPIVSSAVVGHGVVYVGSNDGKLRAIAPPPPGR